MPFTISHAVLAPAISKLSQDRLSISALAIGCMVPDLVRLFTSEDIHSTHLWSAWFYPNLLIGFGFCLIWYLIFRPACFQFIGIDKPLPITSASSTFLFVFYVTISLVIGTATHLIWDGLTHVDYRTFAFHDFLAQSVYLLGNSYPMHRFLQIGTSILALPILLVMARQYYKNHRGHKVSSKIKNYAWGLLGFAFVAGLYGYIQFAEPLGPKAWESDLYWFIGKSINHFFSYFLITFGIGCLLFQFLKHYDYFE